MQFRKAVISDIPVIQQIAEKAWRPTYSHILSEDQTIYMLAMMYGTEVLMKQINSQIAFYLAVEEDLVIGYFAMEITEPSKMKLHKIYLDPDQKSKGAGTKIIEFIKDVAFKAGVRQIELNVNKFNSAVQFYEKIGFFRAKEMVLDIGNGYVMDDYVMQLNLESAQ
ncbi:GNAT family N-acetyltransferase [Aquirufa sp.]|jgi:N-acetylglutamate synthase-like GNAT family acetyltransferase|uniref:GNAT family N-acetyltransferase n=1 Tax=Aquirufa sp. TaxID=2676249 RepID=UPI0037BF5300